MLYLVLDAAADTAALPRADAPSAGTAAAIVKGLLVRRKQLKEDKLSLTLVGCDLGGNSMDYAHISHFGVADHEAHLEAIAEGPGGSAGDLFEGLVLALDAVAKNGSIKSEIVVFGAVESQWDVGDSLEQVQNTITRLTHLEQLTFVANDAAVFGNDWLQTPRCQQLTMWQFWLDVVLRPGVKVVKPTTTCRVELEFGAGGALKLPGYVYISCKENPLPPMKRGEAAQTGADEPAAVEGPVVMNRVLYTQNVQGLEEELQRSDPQATMRAYVYADRYIPVNEIDKNLIELPPELGNKSLKVVAVVSEETYEQFFVYGQTSLFVPDPTYGESACAALASLCSRLRARKLGIVARLKARANHSPKLVLMLPARTKGQHENMRFSLTMNNLTFAGDVRRCLFYDQPAATSEAQLAVVNELIVSRQMNMQKDIFVHNPAHHRLLALLVTRAVDPQVPVLDAIAQVERDEPAPTVSAPDALRTQFGLKEKETRAEERLANWRKANTQQISLAEIFPDNIRIDPDQPEESLQELLTRHKTNTEQLVRVIAVFGDLVNELLIKGKNAARAVELLRALRSNVVADADAAPSVAAYNQVVCEAIAIVKLDRQVFANVEGSFDEAQFITTVDSAASSLLQEEATR